jgi:excisionase family DNA binding protein
MAVEPANPCDPEPGLALPSRHKGRRKTRNRSSVKTHRNYTVEEVARAMGIAKGTIRRWIRSGNLPALMDRKPHLIIRGDLIDYLKGRAIKRVKLPLHECYCFKCRAARPPALAMADYIPLTPTTGNLRAICGTCYSLMHKAVRLAALDHAGWHSFRIGQAGPGKPNRYLESLPK